MPKIGNQTVKIYGKDDQVDDSQDKFMEELGDCKTANKDSFLKSTLDILTTPPNVTDSSSDLVEESFFSIKGRLQRKKYYIRVFLLSVPIPIIDFLTGEEVPIGLLSSFLGILTLIYCYLIIIQTVKRANDINLSGWYWLLLLIPLVNSFYLLYVLFKDGTVGPNKYGKDPKGRVAEKK